MVFHGFLWVSIWIYPFLPPFSAHHPPTNAWQHLGGAVVRGIQRSNWLELIENQGFMLICSEPWLPSLPSLHGCGEDGWGRVDGWLRCLVNAIVVDYMLVKYG